MRATPMQILKQLPKSTKQQCSKVSAQTKHMPNKRALHHMQALSLWHMLRQMQYIIVHTNKFNTLYTFTYTQFNCLASFASPQCTICIANMQSNHKSYTQKPITPPSTQKTSTRPTQLSSKEPRVILSKEYSLQQSRITLPSTQISLISRASKATQESKLLIRQTLLQHSPKAEHTLRTQSSCFTMSSYK